ncbi:hypothetical protein [Tautonia rosea]|uniref:hypothetical protein n=1 Tax=Tautonia rosea TaxID=2728037 RepID=UPI001475CDE9|nr:hypothetical protein [Tautonia rosea]
MLRSIFVAVAVLVGPASASHNAHSPRIPEWKAGDAVMSVEWSALPEVTGEVVTLRSADLNAGLHVEADPVAVGHYFRLTDKAGRHTYLVAGVGEAFAPGDFLKFIPADGVTPARMIWIDPVGVLSSGSSVVKATD